MDLSGLIGLPTGATGITGFRFIAGVDPQNKAKVNSPLQVSNLVAYHIAPPSFYQACYGPVGLP